MIRRLAAVLAADVVGYSRLMGKDEAATLQALRTLRFDVVEPAFERHRGRIAKLMGDGVLAEFSSVVDAVAAAVEIQEQIPRTFRELQTDRKIEIRIGINVGDIVVEDGDIFGDGVNIAARLQEVAKPGGIALSENAYRELRGKFDLPFEDGGSKTLKNILEPIRTWLWPPAKTSVHRVTDPLNQNDTGRPSIAVLPFANLSQDPEQNYFADGMSEDIITLLSLVPDLFVIARNSTFAYKGKSVDVRRVAEELDVRYVLEGSVRKAGNRIRVSGQFVDAITGKQIWAERYDRELHDIFDIQDEVARGIAGALQSRLLTAESAFLNRKPPEQLDAWGNIVNAKLKLFAFRREDLDAAEPFARRAIEIDPNYAEGHAVLGHVLAWRTWNGWTDDFKQTANDVRKHCDLALRLGPNDPSVLTDVAFSLWWLGRIDEAVPHLERAATLNPNSPITLAMHGYCLCAQGRSDEGLPFSQQALRLSPKDPLEYFFLHLLGAGQFHAKQFEESKSTTKHSLQINPELTIALAFLASACVQLNQIQEAKDALARAMALSKTAIPFLFRARPKQVNWHELTDPIREIYDGRLPD